MNSTLLVSRAPHTSIDIADRDRWLRYSPVARPLSQFTTPTKNAARFESSTSTLRLTGEQSIHGHYVCAAERPRYPSVLVLSAEHVLAFPGLFFWLQVVGRVYDPRVHHIFDWRGGPAKGSENSARCCTSNFKTCTGDECYIDCVDLYLGHEGIFHFSSRSIPRVSIYAHAGTYR